MHSIYQTSNSVDTLMATCGRVPQGAEGSCMSVNEN